MKRVFVYEYLTGGGAADVDDETADELLPLGLSMRDAIVADLLLAGDVAVTVAGSGRAGAPPPQAGRSASLVSPGPGESAGEFVSAQAARHDLAWVVAPETGGVLGRLQRRVGPRRWLGCDAASIELATSKRATLLRLAGRGLLTPLAFERTGGTRRWIVKPEDGAGGVATRVHAQREAAWEDAATRSRLGAAMTVEPWVEGEALSLSLLCTGASAECLSINRQQIAVDAEGGLAYEGVAIAAWPLADARAAELRRIAATVARSMPGLSGFVGIDLVWHPQRGPVVIEVNPRVTCAYVGLSAALGRNLGAELVAAFVKEPVDAAA